MEAIARTKNIRISTRKVRLAADSIRFLPVTKALQMLQTTQKHGAHVLIKTLQSAVANAMQKGNVREEDLIITQLEVDGGPTLRRMHVGSRSHMQMYTKRSSHIRIVVSDTKKTAKQNKAAKKAQPEEKEAKKKEVRKAEKPTVTKAKAGKKEEK